ncbi:sigma-B regulation protein RsbQ [Filimonas zeae]|uniref:Hydrolase n=1 Tax=Filimonas zeae TaxID=1737353 RepID=A0A917IL08_9BACT|nr:alpha/beta hydrolase [Filimonas zeae]MDR6337030.1 sigma-B regulation protein RsbQ [Filimonas zeae]GGH56663.1 hydrolase [Filimonas zeae]
MDVIQRNNITVYGNENAKQTIVFGHGFGTDQTSFKQVVQFFGKDYRVILYDNVGGGKADPEAYSPARYSTLNGYVTDLLDICAYLELKDVIYVGHSVSGMIGLLASIRNPEFFSKLVFLGASARYLNDDAAGYVGGFNQEALNGLYDAMSSNYYAWASGFSSIVMNNPDRPQLAATFASTLSAIRPDIALAVAKVIFESDHRADLGKVTKPVLIVQSSEDVAVPASAAEYLHAHIPGSKLVHINSKGHYPHMSAPGEVVTVMQEFI